MIIPPGTGAAVLFGILMAFLLVNLVLWDRQRP